MEALHCKTEAPKGDIRDKNQEPPIPIEALYRQHHSGLCRYAYRFTQCAHLAEEIVSEVFVRFWKNQANLKVQAAAYGYLVFATRNLCIDHLRRKTRTGGWPNELDGDYQTDYASPSELLIGNETQRIIEKAINSLTPKCRQIFKMSREANMTYAEIAVATGLSVKTVEAHMGRSLKTLRERLQEVGVSA